MQFSKKQKSGNFERYRVYLTTHKGLLRDGNEDNFSVNHICKKVAYNNVNFSAEYDTPLLAAVFDGLGGEAMGEHASFLSARAAKALYEGVKSFPEKSVNDLISDFTANANDKICDFLEQNRCRSGGSTVAGVIIKNEIVYPFSLGDSRIYLLRDAKLSQISKDHTLAVKKYEAGIYTFEEAEKSADSHKLTLFLGTDHYRQGLVPQIYEPIVLHKSDKLLLCSDGLYDECSLKQIEKTLKNNPDNPTLSLVKAAVQNGGRDNITCLLVERAFYEKEND